jgi:hypothetical protein
MKSYLLIDVRDEDMANLVLSEILPDQAEPWVLFHSRGDAIAYFDIYLEEGGPLIQADISGRHYYEDKKIIEILKRLQKAIGGTIIDDNENII